MTLYDVRHRTTFEYEQLVSISHHVLHLVPRAHGHQQLLQSSLDIDPPPSQVTARIDYFGNPVNHVTIYEPHRRLVVEARSRVEVESDAPIDPGSGPLWEDLLAMLKSPQGDALDAFQFVFDSRFVSVAPGIKEFASVSFQPGRKLLDASVDLTSRIFREFEYEGGVSDLSTPVAKVLAMKKGVCQDFAHLQIACLRSLGLPARYVSGYLLTHPPEGQPKLIGSDASHAWISVWAGELGWVDFDPTNDVMPSTEHITVGWGRDYGDVSPINGFIIGGGKHEIAVAVDVAAVLQPA